jgi:hypothetical protein
MFKLGSIENELMRSMKQQLIVNQAEIQTARFNKLAKALDYLNAAAAIFDQAGMQDEAADITKVLEDIIAEQTEGK